MKVRSICASLMITATVVVSGGTVSANAATDDMQPRKATSCIDGGRVTVNHDFGPGFKWTLMGIRYKDNQQCNVLITNSGYSGKMVLKVKTVTNGVVTKLRPVKCFGCAELPFGTGGADKVKIKAKASPQGSTEVYETAWYTVFTKS